MTSQVASISSINKKMSSLSMLPDINCFLGDWVNVNPNADFISSCKVRLENNQLLLALSVDDSKLVAENMVLTVFPMANEYQGSAVGFYMYSDELTIAANEKNGVLVLQAYRNSNEKKLLTREFYYRPSGDLSDLGVEEYGKSKNSTYSLAGEKCSTNIDLKSNLDFLIGNWKNTLQKTQWAGGFEITRMRANWTINFDSSNQSIGWSQCSLTPYFFDFDEIGFVAYHQSEKIDSLFTAYSNKGLLVISSFHSIYQQVRGRELSEVFCREFFAKQ